MMRISLPDNMTPGNAVYVYNIDNNDVIDN